jgi:hypothetical protein
MPPEPQDNSENICYMFELFSEKLSLTLSRGRLHEAIPETKKEAVSDLDVVREDRIIFHGARNLLR